MNDHDNPTVLARLYVGFCTVVAILGLIALWAVTTPARAEEPQNTLNTLEALCESRDPTARCAVKLGDLLELVQANKDAWAQAARERARAEELAAQQKEPPRCSIVEPEKPKKPVQLPGGRSA